jgi:hypothetical protein
MADLSSHPASLIFRAAQAAKPFMQKPPLSFWQIWNISFEFPGDASMGLAAALTLRVVTFKKPTPNRCRSAAVADISP